MSGGAGTAPVSGGAGSVPVAGPTAPASPPRRLLAQTRMELRLTARRGENVLVTIVIPVIVLVFFASLAILPTGGSAPVDFLLPGTMALAIIATSLVNLGIATAYERHYGVLKRLGGSPLTRGGLLSAKMLAVLAVEVAQVVLLVAVAAGLLGWRPAPGSSIVLVAVGVLLGTFAFAGLGLFLAGRASCRNHARGRQRPVPRRSCCSAGSSCRSRTCRRPLRPWRRCCRPRRSPTRSGWLSGRAGMPWARWPCSSSGEWPPLRSRRGPSAGSRPAGGRRLVGDPSSGARQSLARFDPEVQAVLGRCQGT